MTERYLTIPEVAEITKESEDNLRRRCAAGQIPAVKLGKSWRVSESALSEFLSPGVVKTPRNKRLTKRQRRQLGLTA